MNEPLENTMPVEILDDLIEKNKEEEQDIEEEKNKKAKKPNVFKRMINSWKKLPKKTKIILIVLGILLIALITFLIIYLWPKKKEETPTEDIPSVIVEKENYRYENGKLIFINELEEDLGEYECQNKDENLCYVAYFDNSEDNFDAPKILDEVGDAWVSRSPILEDKYVFVIDSSANSTKTLKLYNMETKEVDSEYLLIKKVANNDHLVILKDTNSKYGVLEFANTSYTTKIDFTYDYLASIYDNASTNYVATSTKRNLIVSENGDVLTKTIPGDIKNFNAKYVKAMDADNKYHIYDYNAKEIFKETYDYVELYDNYAALVDNKQMYLKTYNNEKLNEEGIRLKNSSYVKEHYFNEYGTLVKTVESFKLTDSNNLISIQIADSDEVKTVNYLEGMLSKDLKYVNYFDGVLYLYKDTDKKELLGSYACTNKNTITKDTKTLDNCYIAKDTTYENNELMQDKLKEGLIPIFNERFVFMKDSAGEGDYTINLYDLKQKRTLSRYQTVNTRSNTGDEITFKTVNDYNVMAQNKNGEYGVITLKLSSAESYISFDYENVELLNEYYLVKAKDGYKLITTSEEVTNFIPDKIQNYNDTYLTATDSKGNYHVYSYEGKKISADEGYTYVKLYDTFYAAVKNNKLALYTYLDNTTNILEDYDLPNLTLTNYYGKGTLAFKIDFKGKNYTISFGDKNDIYKVVFDSRSINEKPVESDKDEVEE